MNDDQAGDNLVGSAQGASHDIGQERAPEALSLPAPVYCQPSKSDRRNLPRAVTAHGAGYLMGENLSHAQCEIADDLVRAGRADDIGAARRQLEIVPGTLPQPVVEDLFFGIEGGTIVGFCQENRRIQGKRRISHSATALWRRAGSCPGPWCSNGTLSRVGCSFRLPEAAGALRRGRTRIHVTLDPAEGRGGGHERQYRDLCRRSPGARYARRSRKPRRHQQRPHRTGAGECGPAQACLPRAAPRRVAEWLTSRSISI